MPPSPIYNTDNVQRPAYHLRYTWIGWPSSTKFSAIPDGFWNDLDSHWENDELRRLEGKWKPDSIQLTFSVKPTVSPVFFTGRVKGRLQHALRQHGKPTKFSRKVAFRTIGNNHRHEVENYIEQQIERSDYIDPDFRETLKRFTVWNSNVDLSKPTHTNSGRYWYNLHVVCVVQQRYQIFDLEKLATFRDTSFGIATKKGHRISRLALLPDHWHASLSGNINHTPEEIALAFMNNLAYSAGQDAIWQYGYYTGTFGEYDMDAVREHAGIRDRVS